MITQSSSEFMSHLREIKESIKDFDTNMTDLKLTLSKMCSLGHLLAASSSNNEAPLEENQESDTSVVSMDPDDPLINDNLNL